MSDRGPSAKVVISYFRDGSHYPRSGRPDRQNEVYWSNIAVQAATFRHVAGSDAEFVAFCGNDPPAQAAEILASAGGRTRRLDFARRPPDDFYVRYLGTLFVLDVMAALADEVDPDDVLLFCDPDIVWPRSPTKLIEEVGRGGVVAYDLAVPEDVPLCDLTRRQQSEILGEIGGVGPSAQDPAVTHFGGEIYGMLGRELKTLVPALEALWAATMKRYEAGLPHYNFEEHVLNGALWQRNETVGRANPHLQRIRTLPKPFGTRDRDHSHLSGWHLPSEKDSGFLKVFDHLAAGGPLPAVGPDYVRWLGRRMGVRPAGVRWVADRARQTRWAITGRFRQSNPTYYGL